MCFCFLILGFGKFSCVDCPATFDKAPKLIFHQQHCGKTPPSNVKVPVSSADNIEKSDFTVIKQGTFQPKPVIEKAIVQDTFVKNNDVHEKSNDVVNNKSDIFGASCSSAFRMPDNFDLPDEIIQEQLPAAMYTSTPIRYGGTGSGITEKDQMETNSSEVLKKSTASKGIQNQRIPLLTWNFW